MNDIGIWIYMVPDRTARNAATAAAAIGAVVLALRALIGKEPGLVEMELK
jgi:L-alanine-DL-glutamate epimerase-like enolase superfamily enzyme